MYLRLRLKNWRSIDDATVVIAPFTVIVGRNSSGKSNIVDALLFSSDVARDAENAVRRRGGITSIRRWSPGGLYEIAIDVRVAPALDELGDSSLGHALVIHSGEDGDWRFIREEINATANGGPVINVKRSSSSMLWIADAETHTLFLADTASAMTFVRQFKIGSSGALRALPSIRAVRPVPDLMRQPQQPTESDRLVASAENITTAIHRLEASHRSEVVAAMRRIVPGLEDVQAVLNGRYLTLLFTQAQGGGRSSEFTATEMSDGALRGLAVIVAAEQMEPDELLIIEEPEVNLHPGAADVVYDVLHRASLRGAVLVTTHSPELLDRAKDDEILVCEYVDGVTKIGPLSSAQRDLVREGLFSTAELMRSEELRREGAAPRVVAD